MQSAAEVPSQTPSIVNGVDLGILGSTVEAIAGRPELGRAAFRARNRWETGSVNHSVADDFHAAGEEMRHQQAFRMSADEPAMLAGGDSAPNPVEHLLHALASCVTTSIVAHAAVKGIEIDRLESRLEGDIDLNGFLGLRPETPKGYSKIRMDVQVKAAEDDFRRIPALATFSPVYNTLKGGVEIELNFERV